MFKAQEALKNPFLLYHRNAGLDDKKYRNCLYSDADPS